MSFTTIVVITALVILWIRSTEDGPVHRREPAHPVWQPVCTQYFKGGC